MDTESSCQQMPDQERSAVPVKLWRRSGWIAMTPFDGFECSSGDLIREDGPSTSPKLPDRWTSALTASPRSTRWRRYDRPPSQRAAWADQITEGHLRAASVRTLVTSLRRPTMRPHAEDNALTVASNGDRTDEHGVEKK